MSDVFKMKCPACNGEIECPNELQGQAISCPICGKEIIAQEIIKAPPMLPRAPIKWKKWILIAILFAIIGLLFFQNDIAYSLPIIIGLALASCLYFLPAIVGRKKRNANAIAILNLFLGWTVLGWVIALVWACTVDSEKT